VQHHDIGSSVARYLAFTAAATSFINMSSSQVAPGQLQPFAACSQASLAASLAEEKRARKLAEDDALRLYNRIRQLQKEEERADRYVAIGPPAVAVVL
jgi:hypothetical protein